VNDVKCVNNKIIVGLYKKYLLPTKLLKGNL